MVVFSSHSQRDTHGPFLCEQRHSLTGLNCRVGSSARCQLMRLFIKQQIRHRGPCVCVCRGGWDEMVQITVIKAWKKWWGWRKREMTQRDRPLFTDTGSCLPSSTNSGFIYWAPQQECSLHRQNMKDFFWCIQRQDLMADCLTNLCWNIYKYTRTVQATFISLCSRSYIY